MAPARDEGLQRLGTLMGCGITRGEGWTVLGFICEDTSSKDRFHFKVRTF